jgi:hypothetical protein
LIRFEDTYYLETEFEDEPDIIRYQKREDFFDEDGVMTEKFSQWEKSNKNIATKFRKGYAASKPTILPKSGVGPILSNGRSRRSINKPKK